MLNIKLDSGIMILLNYNGLLVTFSRNFKENQFVLH